MPKAIFCDFYGTLVHENGPQSFEVIDRAFKSGNAESAEEVVRYWHRAFARLMDSFSGDTYRSQYDLARISFEETIRRFDADEDPDELTDLMVEHWSHPPLYDDAQDFLARTDIPIYIVTNSDDRFVTAAMEAHGLSAEDVFTSERARFAKPNSKIFEYALSQTGLKGHEVVHIGDSIEGDYRCPSSLGISALWLNRTGSPKPQDITHVATDLAEARRIALRL